MENIHPVSSLSSWIPSASPFASNMMINTNLLHNDHEKSDRFMGFKREADQVKDASYDAKTEGPVTVETETKQLSVGTFKKIKGHDKRIKNPRFAFQTRCKVDILDDGYRWRKYGQRAVKNNNFPRSYYRCTHQGCNVKKQVQRLSGDESIVVTTYEGRHTHPVVKGGHSFEQILNQMQIYPPL